MKRLIKTVELEFFNDNATGEWGLTHKDTQDDYYGSAFNAFWDGMGIFHDVFEHSHEYTNKYFRGDYAMNIGGEMAAMGSLWYLYDTLGVYNRLNNNGFSRYSPGENMKETTLQLVQEAITRGYCNFGYTLESNVPKQRPTDNSELEYQISEFWREAKDTRYDTDYDGDEQEKKSAMDYKRSVTFRKIADLHRYGYRMAERFVPDNSHNRNVLSEFLSYWNDLCKENDAEEMGQKFKGITFKIYKDKGEISWKATFNSADMYAIKDMTVNPNRKFYAEDAYKEEFQY